MNILSASLAKTLPTFPLFPLFRRFPALSNFPVHVCSFPKIKYAAADPRYTALLKYWTTIYKKIGLENIVQYIGLPNQVPPSTTIIGDSPLYIYLISYYNLCISCQERFSLPRQLEMRFLTNSEINFGIK